MLQIFFIFFKTLFLASFLLSQEPQVEKILQSESIYQTYEISIPGYSHAYNPSILPYQDGYLLSFRYVCRFPEWISHQTSLSSSSFIGLAHLDKQFQVKKKSVQLLDIPSENKKFSLYAEDARLFFFQDRIFLIFNDLLGDLRRLYLAEIGQEKGRWVVQGRVIPLVLDGLNPIEKNWTPFCAGDQLYLIYGEDPHTILECEPFSGICKRVEKSFVDLDWHYGVIRGGTPALEVDGQFLTFFHSSMQDPKIYERRIYFMGAYSFDSYFPFTIRSYTPLPIGLMEYYKESSSTKELSKKVIFPGGFVREGDFVHIAWGKDDKKVMITTLFLKKLLMHKLPP